MAQITHKKTYFKLILGNEITVCSNRNYFTLAQNGLKANAANQGNHVEWLLVIAIPTRIENNYHFP